MHEAGSICCVVLLKLADLALPLCLPADGKARISLFSYGNWIEIHTHLEHPVRARPSKRSFKAVAFRVESALNVFEQKTPKSQLSYITRTKLKTKGFYQNKYKNAK